MIYRVKPGQVSYGEAIGILLLDSGAPFIPGDVANATTYSYPVRFQRVEGLTVKRIFAHDMGLLERVREAGQALAREGVRAVTGDCGFMAIYQEELARTLGAPVFMSSLLQLPFMVRIVGPDDRIGVITANSLSLDDSVLRAAGVEDSRRLVIRGLEKHEHFRCTAIEETGSLDSGKVEAEVVSAARDLVQEEPRVRLLLLECSMLPPYAAAVQEATGLPVFDFITMIDYVFSAVVRRRYQGFM